MLTYVRIHVFDIVLYDKQGRLLVGSGQSLRLYDLGKRKLLLKCELKGLPSMVVSLLK
jgi:splicing factor 3B subunit 3